MRGKEDSLVWLKDIVDSIDLIESYIANLTKEELFHSEEKQDAVVRRLEIIGEAIKNPRNKRRMPSTDSPLCS